MALSRLRLRLALGYSLTFAAGLTLLSAVALGYLWRESHARLDTRLRDIVADVRTNTEAELVEFPDSLVSFTTNEVVAEWPRNGGSFVICDSAGRPLAHTESDSLAYRIAAAWNHTDKRFDVRVPGRGTFRVAMHRYEAARREGTRVGSPPRLAILAFASTEGISEDAELLLTTLLIALPVIFGLTLSAGYLMAGGALRPVTELRTAIADIGPHELSRTLPVVEPRDEIGMLAAEFNALLARLNISRAQNTKFIREAAHQLRTPLTLVLGEAALELASADSSRERMRAGFARIELAADRMRRRVDELFLLAEAQTGEPVNLKEVVELDEIVLDVTDLIRARASTLGRALAIGRAEHLTVMGNTSLLHEALLEMLENALRHGRNTEPVTVSVFATGRGAMLEVSSAGDRFALPPRIESNEPQGLGLPIVRWVAELHGGTLEVEHRDQCNAVTLIIPGARAERCDAR